MPVDCIAHNTLRDTVAPRSLMPILPPFRLNVTKAFGTARQVSRLKLIFPL